MGLFSTRNERKFKKADSKRKQSVSKAGRDLRNGKSSGGRVLNAHKKSLNK